MQLIASIPPAIWVLTRDGQVAGTADPEAVTLGLTRTTNVSPVRRLSEDGENVAPSWTVGVRGGTGGAILDPCVEPGSDDGPAEVGGTGAECAEDVGGDEAGGSSDADGGWA